MSLSPRSPLTRTDALARALLVAALAAVLTVVVLPASRAANPVSSAPCPTAICVDVRADTPQAVERLSAQGFIHGVDGSDYSALVDSLHARSWLFSDGEAGYNAGLRQGATLTLLLSASWDQATYSSALQGPTPPWNDWGAYARFIANTVRSVRARGVHVDYWEVENEPDGRYDRTDTAGISPMNALEEFDVAQAAVRSVDPTAKVVGPNLAAFNDQAQGTTSLDLTTFLNYVVAHHIRLDAISWHEVGRRANPVDNPRDPESIVIDVSKVRQMIAARPSLGHPAILINEYGSEWTRMVPGWNVAWIEAVERSGVNGANRACWHQDDVSGHYVSDCGHGGVDGLFLPGSGLPQAPYWVHRAYADMTGLRVATASNDGAVTGLAASDDGQRTLRVLVGRHQSCDPTVHNICGEPTSAVPAPADITLRVTLPPKWNATTATVTATRIPDVNGILLAPVPTIAQSISFGPRGGQLTLPGVIDGDAYSLTISAL
jgi:hypothetical protein